MATDSTRVAQGREKAGAAGSRCHNCGAQADWNYCPNCGQETAIALPSAFAFLRDAAGRYVRFDGRMWRSLHALAFRPGFLTREYLAGRRRRYVRPARLFVATSIVLFVVLRFAAGTPVIEQVDGGRTDSIVFGEAKGDADDLGIHVFDFGADRPWLAPLRERVEAFNRLPRQAKADQVVAGVFRYGPYAAIGLLPLFALLLGIVYIGGRRRHPSRPRRYAAHLVFGAHSHAFLFLVATVMALVPYRPLRATLVVWSTLYAFASLRAVYGGRWLGVVLRTAGVALVYTVFFGLAFAMLVLAAVALR